MIGGYTEHVWIGWITRWSGWLVFISGHLLALVCGIRLAGSYINTRIDLLLWYLVWTCCVVYNSKSKTSSYMQKTVTLNIFSRYLRSHNNTSRLLKHGVAGKCKNYGTSWHSKKNYKMSSLTCAMYLFQAYIIQIVYSQLFLSWWLYQKLFY